MRYRPAMWASAGLMIAAWLGRLRVCDDNSGDDLCRSDFDFRRTYLPDGVCQHAFQFRRFVVLVDGCKYRDLRFARHDCGVRAASTASRTVRQHLYHERHKAARRETGCSSAFVIPFNRLIGVCRESTSSATNRPKWNPDQKWKAAAHPVPCRLRGRAFGTHRDGLPPSHSLFASAGF